MLRIQRVDLLNVTSGFGSAWAFWSLGFEISGLVWVEVETSDLDSTHVFVRHVVVHGGLGEDAGP